MQVKILHTGDVHLGMAFSRYPEAVLNGLTQARLAALEKLVTEANRQSCQVFVVAGDLFHHTAPAISLREQVLAILQGFLGNVVALLPGNHDYDDGVAELWMAMERERPKQMLILREPRIYPLDDFGLAIDLYPAPCNRRRSADHRLDWMNQVSSNPERLAIGVAHGAVEGLSPDLQGAYFYMTIPELEAIPVDLWLLAHAHTRYPDFEKVENHRLLICGTPEPDGAGSASNGNAWIITLDENGSQVEAFDPSSYHFYELTTEVSCEEDLLTLGSRLLASDPDHSLVKINLSGKLTGDAYSSRQELYARWQERLYFLEIKDEVQLVLPPQVIDQEFTTDSFPHRLLDCLAEDPQGLQMAYELIGRVR